MHDNGSLPPPPPLPLLTPLTLLTLLTPPPPPGSGRASCCWCKRSWMSGSRCRPPGSTWSPSSPRQTSWLRCRRRGGGSHRWTRTGGTSSSKQTWYVHVHWPVHGLYFHDIVYCTCIYNVHVHVHVFTGGYYLYYLQTRTCNMHMHAFSLSVCQWLAVLVSAAY